METELVKIWVSLPNTFRGTFNEVVKKRGYATYSEVIRDAIRNFISDYEWIDDFKGHHAGTASIIYDPTKYGLSDALAGAQHKYSHLTRFSVNVYVGQDDCLEIVVLDGNGEEIKKLSKDMTAIKGVKFSELSIVSMAKKPDFS
jgi:CopG family transcriptional regulator, nickel-responsive regulator